MAMKINLKNYLESVKYKIQEGFEYGWECFGKNTFALNTEGKKGSNFIYSTQVIFNTKNQTLYEVSFWDYVGRRVFRWINPRFVSKVKKEYKNRNLCFYTASDEMKFEDVSFDSVIKKIKQKVR